MTLADKLVKDVRKQFGEKSAYLAKDIPRRGGISSGSLALDYAIGPLGGMPRDRCVELFGPESSGKTTLGLMTIRNSLDVQTARGALILDTEHKLDPDRIATMLGPRLSRTVVLYPDHIEQAHDMYAELVPSGDICVTMLDSIGGAPTKASGERSAEEGSYGGNAKAVTAFARMAQGMTHKNECLTLGINQVREDLSPNGHQIVTPGGKGWKHACSLRVYLRKGKGRFTMARGTDTVDVGITVAGRIYKNHLGGIEGREFSYWFYNVAANGRPFGVDQGEETVRLSTAVDVITRSGGWYYHPALPDGKVNGLPRLTDVILADEKLRKQIADETLAALRASTADVTLAAESGDTVGDLKEAE